MTYPARLANTPSGAETAEMPASPILDQANALFARGKVAEAVQLLESHSIEPACAVRLREHYLGEHDNERAGFVTRQLAVGHDAEAHVSRSIMALMGRDLDSAVRECEAALAQQPDLATAHNHLGRALQNAGQSLQAISTLRKAVSLQENYPEAWYNLGLVQRASGALPAAIEAYRKALDLSPGYQAAELNLGISLLLAERPDEALFCLESLLGRHPDHVEALVNAGLAMHLLGQFREARAHLERATVLDASNPTAWLYLGMLLHEVHEPEQALEALHQALALDPLDVEAWVEVASIHERANRLEDARQALERGRKADPRHPGLRLELARLQRREGDPGNALETLRSLPAGSLPLRLAQQYHFELGTTLDRVGEFDQAMDAYARGNRVLARSVRRRDIDPQGFERRCQALQAWLDKGAPGAAPAGTDPQDDTGADLCFLVGFPRSGTTLLDTMLDAHPGVGAIEELPTLEILIDELRAMPADYPGAMASLDAQRISTLRGMYREQCRRFLEGREAGLVVDKLPLRFLNLGLVRRLFPQARILFAMRHPCDVVLSNFMQAYAENEAFIHFDTLADSTAMYVRAMSLWQLLESRLGLEPHYSRYEDMAADPRVEMGRVCEFLGLEPVEAMFDASRRMADRGPVRTTSYQQVSEAVYQRSAGRWRNYRKHLEPHLPALLPFIERYGYEA